MKLIGISGYLGAGKDEVAKILVRDHGFVRRAFADALREEVIDTIENRTIVTDATSEIQELIEAFEGDAGGVWMKPTAPKMRRLLQLWGTEYRRELCDPDYWVERMAEFVADCQCPVVIPDVRFPNEFDFVKRGGGEVWRVERLYSYYQDYDPTLLSHSSEHLLAGYDFDRRIRNVGTLDDLAMEVSRPFQAPGLVA